MTTENRLYPEDQAKVDEFLSTGVNSVERKPFQPFKLLFFLIIVVSGLTWISLKLPELAGIY
jgi:hypothetical protein